MEKSGGYKTINLPLQKLYINVRGRFCLYLVRYLVKKQFSLQTAKKYLKLQTTELDVVRFFNEHDNNAQFE